MEGFIVLTVFVAVIFGVKAVVGIRKDGDAFDALAKQAIEEIDGKNKDTRRPK